MNASNDSPETAAQNRFLSGDATKGEAIVSLRGVTKKFGETVVFKDVDLDVGVSEVVVLIGPSGAGKSTLLRCVNGLEQITSGDIVVAGQTLSYDQKHLNRIRSRIGMVFQAFNL
ncbi:MAG: ATP-binding cassette domain-containing protein, partial [Propionibacteriaceae bacterium]|nr:ATP-binding cassette domain-containing protein [Propionibacteriaceae bacterium]